MTFLDFFAGIGGFRIGMEQAGHTCVGHIEIDKYANKSYQAMHNPKESEFFANDIRDVRPDDLPSADCYCGGFPCQSFSVAGKRGGFADTRGTLFFEVMRLAAVRKPKYIFLENVAGLLSHDGGKTFGTILSTLGELGYWYEYQVLNSKNHGAPQNRERVFIVGHLGTLGGRKVFPIGQNDEVANGKVNRLQDTRQIAGALRATDYKGTHNMVRMIGIDKSSNNPRVLDIANCLTTREDRGVSKHKAEGTAVIVDDTQGFDGVRYYEDAAPTLRSHRSGLKVLNGFRIRKLTPKECFRLQGFPDEYFERAKAVNSDSQLYKQAGNSVTVNVIHEIAERLAEIERDTHGN